VKIAEEVKGKFEDLALKVADPITKNPEAKKTPKVDRLKKAKSE
jgi:hypothetical protein